MQEERSSNRSLSERDNFGSFFALSEFSLPHNFLLPSFLSDPPSAPRLIGDDLGAAALKRAAGDRVRLECVSSGGNPVPQIEWRRNGRPLPEGQSVPNSLASLDASFTFVIFISMPVGKAKI